MSVHLWSLGAALPPYAHAQTDALAYVRHRVGGERRVDRLLSGLYAHSGVDTRHSVLASPEPDGRGGDPLFLDAAGGPRQPGTAERNARYRRDSGPLARQAATGALEGVPDVGPEDVTHLVTVSCTGMHAPGTDLELIRGLGLPPTVERYHLGFMGCYAAFPALRLARAFCRAEPEAVVLIVTVELCTLHLQTSREPDALLAGSLFADGAAGLLVSARSLAGRSLRLEAGHDLVAPEGADDMTWTVGDTGFEMTLSRCVPERVSHAAPEAVRRLLEPAGLTPGDVALWAVHPGGPAVLDAVASSLELPGHALDPSREVLARHGNVSSATVPLVLARLLEAEPPPGEPLVAMAFGPGLTVATALLRTA